jgi:hypothetical protein
MTPEEILLDTIAVLEKGGWQKDKYGSSDNDCTPHCVVGAMRVAAGDWVTTSVYPSYNEAMQRLAKLVNPEVPADDIAVFVWNDEQDSAEDIILALKKAAHGE